jgi:hypothetical protein
MCRCFHKPSTSPGGGQEREIEEKSKVGICPSIQTAGLGAMQKTLDPKLGG